MGMRKLWGRTGIRGGERGGVTQNADDSMMGT